MFMNSGPVVVGLGDRTYLLDTPSPEGLSMLVAYVRKKQKEAKTISPIDRVMDRMAAYPNLAPEVRAAMATAAVKCDAEIQMRGGAHNLQDLPADMFFEPDAAGLLLYILAVARQPEMTLDSSIALVVKVGVEVVVAKLGVVMSGDAQKKDPALLVWLSNITTPTGPSTPADVASPA